MLSGDLTHLRLGHSPQRKVRVGKLLLRQAEEKIRLVLGKISGSLQNPTAPLLVELIHRVMPSGNALCANAPRCLQ